MANSLRTKIKKLCHDGKIDTAEQEMLLRKLDGHDEQVRADERARTIEEFVKAIEKNQTRHDSYSAPIEFDMSVDMTDILKIAEQLKEQNAIKVLNHQ